MSRMTCTMLQKLRMVPAALERMNGNACVVSDSVLEGV